MHPPDFLYSLATDARRLIQIGAYKDAPTHKLSGIAAIVTPFSSCETDILNLEYSAGSGMPVTPHGVRFPRPRGTSGGHPSRESGSIRAEA